MVERRRIHLGIDYGTSTSKIVFRDYGALGGEKAYPVIREGTFRIPSSVAMSASDLTFGTSPQAGIVLPAGLRWYESVKMRVAGEAKGDYNRYCYAPLPALPFGFTAKDLAVLAVWFLISEGYRAVREYLRSHTAEFALGMTLGVPMSFYTDSQLRTVFLDIARTAWRLYRSNGSFEGNTIRLSLARKLLDDSYNTIVQSSPIPEEEVRNWIRSEAEAAMWWPFQSPAVAAGPYAKVDIGAGTTNSSIFRIVDCYRDGRWVKEKLAFFGAYSHPVGMDALDQALARWRSLPEESCLVLRGREHELLSDGAATSAVSSDLDKINEAYRHAWKRAFPKLQGSPHELKCWDNHRIFVIGGGSLVKAIRERVCSHPFQQNRLEIQHLEHADDLQMPNGSKIPRENLPFLTVAYGLSNIGLAIPEVETPDEIPPLPSAMLIRSRLDRDDIYAK